MSLSCCCTTCATMHTIYFVCNTYLFTLSVNMLFSYLNCAPTSELRIRLSNSNIVRICCIGVVGLHHLFYKGAVGPLGLPAASPGVSPLGLQGRQPIRVQGVCHPWCRLPQVLPPLEAPHLVPPLLAGPRGSPPPINVTPHLSIETSNCTAIHLLSHGIRANSFFCFR
jgi:hypothetical protein